MMEKSETEDGIVESTLRVAISKMRIYYKIDNYEIITSLIKCNFYKPVTATCCENCKSN